MSIGTLNRIKAALGTGTLPEDQKIVLEALMKAGYDEKGEPKGRAGMLSSNSLAQVVYPLVWETSTPSYSEERSRLDTCKRRVRKAINSLVIEHGISICCVAGLGGGYYLPATTEDVESNHDRFHRRAMTGLVKASRARKGAYADAMIQLSLGFEAEARRIGALTPEEDDGPPAWVSVVTGLLHQVKGDPARYASEIKRLQDEFGDIFVRRDQVAKIRQLSSELNRVLDGLQA